MKAIYKTERTFNVAEQMAFELLKAITTSNPVCSFVITANELIDLQSSFDASQFSEEDITAIENGTAFMGIPIHVVNADYIDDKELKGFAAVSKITDKSKYN